MKTWKIIAAIVVLLAAGVYIAIDVFGGQGMYQPGQVHEAIRAGAFVLEPPAQPNGYVTDAKSGKWLVADDISLQYYRWDDASTGEKSKREAVLLVHGGPGIPLAGSEAVDPIIEEFPNLAVYSYHARGSGLSSRPINFLDPEDQPSASMHRLHVELGILAQVADIERIRRLLGVDRLVLVGHSYGGLFTTLYAIEFANEVAGVIDVAPMDTLVFPSPFGSAIDQLLRYHHDSESSDFGDTVDFVKRYFNLDSLRVNSEKQMQTMNIWLSDKLEELYQLMAVDVKLEHIDDGLVGGWMPTAMFIGLGGKHDYTPAVETIDCPVLVIHGESMVQPEEATRTFANTDNAKLVTLPNAGPFPFLDAPEAYKKHVVEFVRSLRLR